MTRWVHIVCLLALICLTFWAVREQGRQVDAIKKLASPVAAMPDESCGYVDPPVPVYRKGTDTLCLRTRYVWCKGDIVLLRSKDVLYERRTAVNGELVRCEGDSLPLDYSDFAFHPQGMAK